MKRPWHLGAIMKTENASWAGRHRKLVISLPLAVLVLAAIVILFMPGLVAPWSRLNNEEQEMGLCSGRARFTRYFLYVQVTQNVVETVLSEVLAKDESENCKEQWVKVNISQAGTRNSPHFTYHGAFARANALANLWRFYEFDAGARQRSAHQLLRAMREGGSYYVGGEYLRLLEEVLGPEPKEGQSTSIDKIPEDLVERTLAKHAEEMRQ